MKIRAAVLEEFATPLDPFISHRLTLEDVNEGFALIERQDGIRSVPSHS